VKRRVKFKQTAVPKLSGENATLSALSDLGSAHSITISPSITHSTNLISLRHRGPGELTGKEN